MKVHVFSRILLVSACLLWGASGLWGELVDARVNSLEGAAYYMLPDQTAYQPLEVGTILPHGTTVRTEEGAEVIVRVVSGAAMLIEGNTTVKLDKMEFEKVGEKVLKRKARIHLSEGTISALLDHRDPHATDFRIETPQGSAAARGTFYGVSVVDGETFVSVKEGKVGVAKAKLSQEGN